MRERKAVGYLDQLLGRHSDAVAAQPPRRLHWPEAGTAREPGNALAVPSEGARWAAAQPNSGRAVARERPAGSGSPASGSGPPAAGSRGPGSRPASQLGPHARPDPGRGEPVTMPSSMPPLEPAGERRGAPPGETPQRRPAAAPVHSTAPEMAPDHKTAAVTRPADRRPADAPSAPGPFSEARAPAGGTRAGPGHVAPAAARTPKRSSADLGSATAVLPPIQRGDPNAGTTALPRGEPPEVRPVPARPPSPSATPPQTAPDRAARIEIGVLEVRVSPPPPVPAAASDFAAVRPRPDRLSRAQYPFGLRQG